MFKNCDQKFVSYAWFYVHDLICFTEMHECITAGDSTPGKKNLILILCLCMMIFWFWRSQNIYKICFYKSSPVDSFIE